MKRDRHPSPQLGAAARALVDLRLELERLAEEYDRLAARADAAYERGDLERAEDLDARLQQVVELADAFEAEIEEYEHQQASEEMDVQSLVERGAPTTYEELTEAGASVSIDEDLARVYHKAFVERDAWFGREEYLRSAIDILQTAVYGGGMAPTGLREDITAEELIAAGRDAYEMKVELLRRYRRGKR